MKTTGFPRRLLAGLLTLCLTLTLLAPSALADWTTLQVSFYGLVFAADGTCTDMQELTAVFQVLQQGEAVGTLRASPMTSELLTLPGADEVLLVPDPDTAPDGWTVEPNGYAVSITPGKLNQVRVFAYASNGLFQLQADPGAAFTVTPVDAEQRDALAADGVTPLFPMAVQADAEGHYTAEALVPCGAYVLQDAAGVLPDVSFTVEPFRGTLAMVPAVEARAAALLPATLAPTEEPTPVPTDEPTPEPTEEPTPEPTPEPTEEPTPEPTPEPTEEPTPEPTEEPTPEPTEEPTPVPTEVPTPEPTEEPTPEPTEEPTPEPTEEPTPVPTEVPTPVPTEEPTPVPTEVPTPEPTEVPTPEPTEVPTPEPTEEPTPVPTEVPTPEPTEVPTPVPTEVPTPEPTEEPTPVPTEVPTPEPTEEPTPVPTEVPTPEPTEEPTPAPTEDIFAGMENIELDETATISGQVSLLPIPDAEEEAADGVRVILSGNGKKYALMLDEGSFLSGALAVGRWHAEIELPDGSFEGEGWSFTEDEFGVIAARDIQLTENTVLPAITQTSLGAATLAALENPEAVVIEAEAVTPMPTEEPTPAPTAEPTPEPTAVPTPEPTAEPTEVPTPEPTAVPTEAPTPEPTEAPTPAPTEDLMLETIEELELTELSLPTEAPAPVSGASAETDAAPLVTVATPEPAADPESLLSPSRERSYVAPRALPEKAGVLGSGNSAVSVIAFNDKNHNGAMEQYDEGVAGIQVELIERTDSGDAVIASELSDGRGIVLFRGLPEGTYLIRSTLPVGRAYGEKGKKTDSEKSSVMERQSATVQESEAFTVGRGQTWHCGIGTVICASISGRVFMDSNEDGLHDPAEPGLAGMIVEAAGRKNGLVYQTVTDENGNYTLSQLRAGAYNLRFTLPDGMVFTNTATAGNSRQRTVLSSNNLLDNSSTGQVTVDLNTPSDVTGEYIGLLQASKVTVRCFMDRNYNGRYDEGEPGVSGVKLVLYRDFQDAQVDSITTGADGEAVFGSLRPKKYYIRSTLPSNGSSYSILGSGETGNVVTAREGNRAGTVDVFDLPAGENRMIYIGLVRPATISGTVYMDENYSGRMDNGEDGQSGIQVYLLDKGGLQVAHTSTGRSGSYSFENLMPGDYTVSITAAPGLAFTTTGEGSQVINRGSGVASTELMAVYADDDLRINAGMIQPGTVKGTIFGDENDNGAYDAGEGGLAGAVVSLIDEGGQTYTSPLSASGAFKFDAVMPGTYYLRYELTENSQFVLTDPGMSVLDHVATTASFRVDPGTTITAPLCGGIGLGLLDGGFFRDENSNGLRDAGEAAVSGVTITLTPTRPELFAVTAQTGADGAFRIDNLRADQYTLSITLPEGLVFSRLIDIGLPLETGADGVLTPLDIPMGAAWFDQEIGLVQPASLSGLIWLDENNNGLHDAGENPGAGMQVEMLNADGSLYGVLTADADGRFASESLIPGTYALRFRLDDAAQLAVAGDTTFAMADDGSRTAVMEQLTLRGGDHLDHLRLGLIRYASMGGRVWLDQNGTVVPLTGAAVSLCGSAGELLDTVTSGEDGRYVFEKLMPGEYILQVTLPQGQVVVHPDDIRLGEGGLISVMTACDGRSASSPVLTLRMGSDVLDYDIGSVLNGKLGDLCWLDLNMNGLQDSTEGGLPGLTLHLLQDGTEVASTVTDAYGFYTFEDLYPGVYTIRADYPAEVAPTVQRDDIPGLVSVLGEDGISVELIAVSGGHNYNADLGFRLVTEGVYPAGYGTAPTQIWK